MFQKKEAKKFKFDFVVFEMVPCTKYLPQRLRDSITELITFQ